MRLAISLPCSQILSHLGRNWLLSYLPDMTHPSLHPNSDPLLPDQAVLHSCLLSWAPVLASSWPVYLLFSLHPRLTDIGFVGIEACSTFEPLQCYSLGSFYLGHYKQNMWNGKGYRDHFYQYQSATYKIMTVCLGLLQRLDGRGQFQDLACTCCITVSQKVYVLSLSR